MAELRIKLNDSPSKAEEIEALEKIQKFFSNKDTYLKGLFTDDLVSWVSIRIKDDIGPDLYGWLSGEMADFSNAFIERDEAREHLRNKDATIAELQSANEILAEKSQEQRNTIQLLNDECTMIRTEMYDMTEDNDKRRQEVVELKAKLYDLMTQRKEKEDD